jgi:hypothetical protein
MEDVSLRLSLVNGSRSLGWGEPRDNAAKREVKAKDRPHAAPDHCKKERCGRELEI